MGIEKPINQMKKGKDGAYKHWRILKLVLLSLNLLEKSYPT
jgi:hypothetical protein